MTVCRRCGLPESEHHQFERVMPRGCVCKPEWWLDDPPEVCDSYVIGPTGMCATCSHEKECHK
jgi:hypothetical protein